MLYGWNILVDAFGIVATLIGLLLSGLGFVVSVISAWAAVSPLVSERRRTTILKNHLSLGQFTEEDLKRATKNYIFPKCVSIDPANEIDLRDSLVQGREDLFEKMNFFLDRDQRIKHLLILAGSGMGKTSFLLNYIAYNYQHRKKKKHDIELVYLGMPDANERIKKIANKKLKIIFLDAFDEDVKAQHDFKMRMEEILDITQEFKRVVITSRTQFFPNETEIPAVTRIPKTGARGPGESGWYEFYRLFMSPFDDDDIKKYINKLYKFWQKEKRNKAFILTKSIPSLSARPMLIANIPEILEQDININSLNDLYRFMVNSWIVREDRWIAPDKLHEISIRIATNIIEQKEILGMERLPREKVEIIANECGYPDVKSWQITGRSLLNHDANGNYKFAHRSILEFLFINAALDRHPYSMEILSGKEINLTDQMFNFRPEELSLKLLNVLENRAKTPAKIEAKKIKFLNNDSNEFLENISKYTTIYNFIKRCPFFGRLTPIMLNNGRNTNLLFIEFDGAFNEFDSSDFNIRKYRSHRADINIIGPYMFQFNQNKISGTISDRLAILSLNNIYIGNYSNSYKPILATNPYIFIDQSYMIIQEDESYFLNQVDLDGISTNWFKFLTLDENRNLFYTPESLAIFQHDHIINMLRKKKIQRFTAHIDIENIDIKYVINEVKGNIEFDYIQQEIEQWRANMPDILKIFEKDKVILGIFERIIFVAFNIFISFSEDEPTFIFPITPIDITERIINNPKIENF